MIAHLALGIAAAFAPLQDAPGGALHGQLLSEANGRPLAFAIVELVGVSDVFAAADHTGRYVLEGVPSGRQLLRAKHIGHTPLEVEVWVPSSGRLTLDFSLELQPVRLPAVTALGAPVPGARDSTAHSLPPIGLAGVRALETTPGFAELGLGEVGREIGGEQPPDPSDILYVRGSTADLKRVLLDGAPVTAPFHLGGLIEAFEPAALGAAHLYLGGAPARYDGGLSYILDLQTRPGHRDAARAEARVDLLSAGARAEGPIGSRSGYLVTGRRLHGSGAAGLLDDPFPYAYADGLARVDAQLGRRGTIAAMGFLNRESVRIHAPESGRPEASWGNAAGSLRYRGVLAAHQVEATAAFGRYTAQLPLGGALSFDSDAVSDQTRLTLDLTRRSGPLRFQYGLGYEHHELSSTARSAGPTSDSTVVVMARTDGAVAGAYVDLGWEPNSSLRLRGGLRGDLFSSERQPRLAPRLSATWLVTERAALTIAAGKYHQYVRVGATEFDDESFQDDAGIGALLPFYSVAAGSHLRVALDQRLGEGVRLGIEAYSKRFWDLPIPEQETAEAAGLDLWVHRDAGRVTGWLGYSLGWTWSVDEAQKSSDFSGRHVLSGGLAAPLGSNGVVNFRVAYGAGLPFAAIPQQAISDEPVGMDRGFAQTDLHSLRTASNSLETAQHEPVGPYLRLDAEVARTWKPTWAGIEWEITPYLKVLNALDRRDALFYLGERGVETPQALAPLPILPVIGVNWRF